MKDENRSLSFEDKPILRIKVNYHHRNAGQIYYDVIRGTFLELNGGFGTPGKQDDSSFNLRSIQLLPSPYKTDCIHYNSRSNSFGSDQECYQDCLSRFEINNFGCLNEGYLKADQFFSRAFDFCAPNQTLNSRSLSNCESKCKPSCLLHDFELFYNLFDNQKLVNSFILNLFPRDKSYLKYIYTPKMDVDQLVYNLGGILGFWFGLSAYALAMEMLRIYLLFNKRNIKLAFNLIKKILFYRREH
jgi:hypothetical protein